MGLERAYLDFIERSIEKAVPPPGGWQRLCELGNQRIRASAAETGATTGKEYFSRRYQHVSIDLNGLDGALRLDLSTPIHGMRGLFDIVTNSGVSEHVSDHYACFENIHGFATPTGLMIHLVPSLGSWPKHGMRWYTPGFFRDLAAINEYVIVSTDDIAVRGERSHLVCVSLQRRSQKSFVPRALFEALFSVHCEVP